MPMSDREKRASIIQAKLTALQQYQDKDSPQWSKLLQLLILDTKDVSHELQRGAWEALSEAAKILPAFPSSIFTHATDVVTSGDGRGRAFAAEVLCSIAAHKHSWPVSQRSGHAVAAVDDALLSLAVGMQDMNPQVRHDVVLLLPQLRTASEKYVSIVLDKRKTLVLQRKDPSAAVSKLPEASSINLEGAAGALSQLLEDEFDFVRCAAARAIAAFSCRSAELAETALELLMSALFDDEPILRVAALAGIRVALGTLNKEKPEPPHGQHAGHNRGQRPKKGPRVPEDLYQAVRNCLGDSSMAVRLAAVRILNGMKFPDASKLHSVLHRLITIASPLQWVPLPVAECKPALTPASKQLSSQNGRKQSTDNPRSRPHAAACSASHSVAASQPASTQVQLQLPEPQSCAAVTVHSSTPGAGTKPPVATKDAETEAVHPAVDRAGHCGPDTQKQSKGTQAADGGLQGKGMRAADGYKLVCDGTARAHSQRITDSSDKSVGKADDTDERQTYETCALCVMQVLRTLAAVAACNAEHIYQVVPLIMNSKLGFSVPNVGPLKDLVGHLGASSVAKPSSSCAVSKQQQAHHTVQKRSAVGGPDTSRQCDEKQADAQQGRQRENRDDDAQVSIDVMKAAIEQGKWKVVPKDTAPGAHSSDRTQSGQPNPAEGTTQGSAAVATSTSTGPPCGSAVPRPHYVSVKTRHVQPWIASLASPQVTYTQHPEGVVKHAHHTDLQPPDQLQASIHIATGATEEKTIAEGVQPPALSPFPPGRAPSSHAGSNLTPPRPLKPPPPHAPAAGFLHPHAPAPPKPLAAGPPQKRPALMHHVHSVNMNQAQQSGHVTHAAEFMRPPNPTWRPQMPASHAAVRYQHVPTPPSALPPPRPHVPGHNTQPPRHVILVGGNMLHGQHHVMHGAHGNLVTVPAPHPMHSGAPVRAPPMSAQPARPPSANLYSVTPLSAVREHNSSQPAEASGSQGDADTQHAQRPALDSRNASDGKGRQGVSATSTSSGARVLDAEDWREKLARMPSTAPVLRDAGSDILRSVATIVMLVNAAYASQKAATAAAGSPPQHDPSQEPPATELADDSMNNADASSIARGSSAPVKGLELQQEGMRRLTELCKQWKPVCQALAAGGCIGEWRLGDVLPQLD